MARPLREFSDKMIGEIEACALVGCQNNTIASKLDIPINTLTRRFGKLITKKRAERKYNIRAAQAKAIEQGNPAMLIFLGKNELNQVDKQEIHQRTEEIPSLSKAEKPVLDKLCSDYKLRVAGKRA